MQKTRFIPILFLIICTTTLWAQNRDTTCICGQITPKLSDNIIVEEIASYPGGLIALQKHLNSLVKPESEETGALKVSFIVSCKGRTCDYKIVETKGNLRQNSSEKIIESLEKMENWNPAKQRNKGIDVPYILKLNISKGLIQIENYYR